MVLKYFVFVLLDLEEMRDKLAKLEKTLESTGQEKVNRNILFLLKMYTILLRCLNVSSCRFSLKLLCVFLG